MKKIKKIEVREDFTVGALTKSRHLKMNIKK